jgi:translation initiation factor IF-2
MPKVRVYEIAKQLNIGNKELLDIIADLGINVKNHMSMLEDEETKIIMEMFAKEEKEEADTIENENEVLEDEVITIQLPVKVTVKELADALERPSSEIVKILMARGIMLSLNEQVDFIIATEIGARGRYT